MERLQRVLAEGGVASRRTSEEIIRQGRVLVNGQTAGIGMKVDPEVDHILVDGKPIQKEEKIYLLLNKPVNYLSTVSDPQHRPTVLDLVGDGWGRIYPVGRLDKDSRGLLLLSNDGRLTNRLLHPRYGVTKAYQVLLAGHFIDAGSLVEGLPLSDGWARATSARILSQKRKSTTLHLTLKTGKKRQIRRMFAYLGFPVLDLKRTAVAFLTLLHVAEGDYRSLTREEVYRLKQILTLE